MQTSGQVHTFVPIYPLAVRALQNAVLAGKPHGAAGTQRHAPPNRQYPLTVAAAAASTSEGYDVYANEPQPLQEGVRKHILSVFVADEAGLINRVAGVFARRNANIESLAVGLTTDKALFTIVATGTEAVVSNLCKQLAKLVNVRFVEDITDEQYTERELVLAKVRAPPGPSRSEITQLAQIFRAHIIDVGEATFTMSVTGDPGKIAAFEKVLTRFGIVELVRTGRIALKRGEQLFDDGRWSQAERSTAGSGGVREGGESFSALASQHDVYAVGSSDNEGVWSVQNILDAAYNPEYRTYDPFTLSIDVADVPGVLNQVTGVIARRGYNVQSLAVGPSEREGRSRITLVIPGDTGGVAKLIKQLNKCVYVERVTELHGTPHTARELMLIKVSCSPGQRGELIDLAAIFHGRVCDVSKSTLSVEVTGKETKMRALQEVLEPYGILEVARTGRVALARESGVDSRYLSSMAGSRVML